MVVNIKFFFGFRVRTTKKGTEAPTCLQLVSTAVRILYRTRCSVAIELA